MTCVFLNAFSQQGRGKHFAAGAIVGSFSSWNKVEPKNAVIVSTCLAAAAGFSKEAYDYNSGYRFDRLDLAFTVLGGLVSGVVVQCIKRKALKKKQLRLKVDYKF